ncbi:MAG: hypothetical protein PF447_11600 [Spirochaetaceae bacterium]|nr:hypothetical protein [Spirochaetaceae bacterium]
MGIDAYYVLDNTGDVWAWGNRYEGSMRKVREGSDSNYLPLRIPGIGNVEQISAGRDHVLTIRQDGTFWGWGSSLYGHFIPDTDIGEWIKTPILISDKIDWKQISSGRAVSYAINDKGDLYQWGGYSVK